MKVLPLIKTLSILEIIFGVPMCLLKCLRSVLENWLEVINFRDNFDKNYVTLNYLKSEPFCPFIQDKKSGILNMISNGRDA
jgi:hypothetical protein